MLQMQARLCEEKGVSAGIGTLWRFFRSQDYTVKKNGVVRVTGLPDGCCETEGEVSAQGAASPTPRWLRRRASPTPPGRRSGWPCS